MSNVRYFIVFMLLGGVYLGQFCLVGGLVRPRW